jgi:murein DD-endopeptidase MepM/ murein hydrolase activator NlpD
MQLVKKLKYMLINFSNVAILVLMIITFSFLGPTNVNGSERESFSFIDLTKTDSLKILNGKIQTGETLSNILVSYDVSYSIINEVERISKPVFDLRKIRSGNNYFIINGSSSTNPIQYLIYEQNLIDYVVFKLDNPVNVFKGKNSFEIKKRTVTGIIESSLFDALTGNNFPHELAFKLTELYAYILDFHHLQKGDYFKVIYNEKHVGKKPAALEKILAVCFNHRRQDFYAFYFEHDSGGRYYDQNGNSLEKYFLKSPLKYTTITSRYSKRRLHPILNYHRPHLGVDYAAPKGTPIMSVGDGTIRKATYHKKYGNYVTIMHNGIYSTQYLHMSKIGKKIRPGVSVQKGDVIGYVGSTGLATGPHVEFRVFKNGKAIDPLKAKMPTAKPLKKKYTGVFQDRMAELKGSLDKLELDNHFLKKSLAKD